MDLAQFNADDTAFVQSIEDQTADAMKINDPIDRHQALHRVIDENSVYRQVKNREDKIEEISSRALNKALNWMISIAVVVSCILGGCLGFLIAGEAGVGGGVVIGGCAGSIVIGGALGYLTDKKFTRAQAAAEKSLEGVQNRIDLSFKPAIAERNRLFDNGPQVKEYFSIKNKTLTDDQIKAMVNEKFRPKTVTPDDLAVTLPESGAVKPSIKLKKG